MNKEFVTEFIEVYRKHTSLWKIKSSEYVNKNLKNLGYTALIEVCRKFNIKADREIVKRKIQSLRGAFRKEYNKVEQSTRSGRGLEEIYTPNLWYFDQLLFLKDQEQPTASISNVTNPSTFDDVDDREEGPVADYLRNNTEEGSTQDSNEPENVIEESQVTSPEPVISPSVSTSFVTEGWRTRKRQKKNEAIEHLNFLKACTTALTSSSSNNEVTDDSDAFGVYVGKKLKGIKDASQKMYAETLITQVLQSAVMGTLSASTVLTNSAWFNNNQQNQPSNNNVPRNTGSNSCESIQQYYSTFTNI